MKQGRKYLSEYAKLFGSLRATAKQSQSVAITSFHFVPLVMTNAQLILPKYLLHYAPQNIIFLFNEF